MPIYTDLSELKTVLEIDNQDSTEDLKLAFFIEQVTSWINEYLNYPGGIDYKTRTEYYQGSGTQKLLLRHRPAYPNASAPYSPIQITYDSNGFFGAASGSFGSGSATSIAYTYGVDYTLQIDQDDGGSRSGIVHRINELWTKPVVRQAGWLSPFVWTDLGSLQVIYTAGYTVDTLPAAFRMACNQMVARMRYIMPLGMAMEADAYEERSIGLIEEHKDYMMGLCKNWLSTYRNWKW